MDATKENSPFIKSNNSVPSIIIKDASGLKRCNNLEDETNLDNVIPTRSNSTESTMEQGDAKSLKEEDVNVTGAEKEEDVVLDAIGYWGKWQAKAFFCLGLFFLNAVLPTMVLTFLNVRPDSYYCKQPEYMAANLSKLQWLEVGQIEQAGGTVDKCTFADIEYQKITRFD